MTCGRCWKLSKDKSCCNGRWCRSLRILHIPKSGFRISSIVNLVLLEESVLVKVELDLEGGQLSVESTMILDFSIWLDERLILFIVSDVIGAIFETSTSSSSSSSSSSSCCEYWSSGWSNELEVWSCSSSSSSSSSFVFLFICLHIISLLSMLVFYWSGILSYLLIVIPIIQMTFLIEMFLV